MYFFIIGFRSRASLFLNWVWARVVYGRGARLITGDDDDAHRSEPIELRR
jgi:hypothetical protein